jgi:hypothetical protein
MMASEMIVVDMMGLEVTESSQLRSAIWLKNNAETGRQVKLCVRAQGYLQVSASLDRRSTKQGDVNN